MQVLRVLSLLGLTVFVVACSEAQRDETGAIETAGQLDAFGMRVGDCFDDTIPDLRRQWIGQRRGMHVDSYRRITRVDGHRVEVLEEPDPRQSGTPKLWFVNLGAYDPNDMAERHRFGLLVASSPQAAKARAKRLWLRGLDQVHKDDLHVAAPPEELDDLLPIEGNGRWRLKLTPLDHGEDPPEKPDWYGYRLL